MRRTSHTSMCSMAASRFQLSMSMAIPSTISYPLNRKSKLNIPSQGLPLTGTQSSGCSSNLGQIYARGVASNGRFAIMYSWYMPKDEPSYGLGHRHEWEGVIIWLASSTSTSVSNILAVCPSAHGKWDCSTTFLTAGTGALVAYFSIWPVNHQMWLSAEQGGQQPLIAWESLPTAARDALTTTDFGSATVPFKDSTFAGNVAAATF